MSSFVHKAAILARDQRDAGDRIRNKLNCWLDLLSPRCSISDIARADECASRIARLFDAPSEDAFADGALRVAEQIDTIQTPPNGPGGGNDGTVTLGRLCYLACRYLRPSVVVETGVAYGVTSTYILSALEDNGHGELYSIDLPPLADDAEKHIGYFIRPELRGQWRLQIGPAQKLLPDLLLQKRTIDMFVHDSLHTYSHMKWEFEAALRSLRPGGVLISDDIEGNRAFEEAARHPSVASWFAIRQRGKDAICGALRTRS